MENFSIKDKNHHPLFPSLPAGRQVPLGEGCLKDRVRALMIFLLLLILAYFMTASGCGELGTGLTRMTISPKESTVGVNQSVLFTAIGRDTTGKLVSITPRPTWSVTSEIGTITSGGLFTSGSNTGQGKVIVTANNLSAEANVVVTDKGWFQGTIFDTSGKKIQDIKVYLMGYIDTLFAFSNTSGFYSISNVPVGTYEVWTEATSVYRAASSEAKVSINAGQTKTVNLTITSFISPPTITPPTVPF
jgi:hypothetical protein